MAHSALQKVLCFFARNGFFYLKVLWLPQSVVLAAGLGKTSGSEAARPSWFLRGAWK